MKKKIIFTIFCISILLTSVILFYKNNRKYYNSPEYDAMLAMTLDGNRIEQFPERGKYSVDITCKNADGSWNSEDWKLVLENITGKVVCNLDFFSAPSTIANIVETKISDSGDVVTNLKEKAEYDILSSEKEYGTITNNSTYPYEFDSINKKWTMTAASSATSYFKFYPNQNGFYQVCYELPSSASTTSGANYSNYIRLYNLNTTSGYSHVNSNINSGEIVTGCKDYGYVTTSDYIYIAGKYYDANISFYVQKTDDYISVSSGYRYIGGNPDNYIWFNNEMWRIIGSIPTKIDSSGTTENLVKIIRKDSLGVYAYDTSGNESGIVWNNSTLFKLLSEYYINKQNGTNTNLCYVKKDEAYAKCDFTNVGIDLTNYSGKMIKKVYWNTGNIPITGTVYWPEIYEKELSNQSINSYIGLISPSDFGYAMDSDYYVSTFSNSLAKNNWLYGYGQEWTNVRNSESDQGIICVSEGGIDSRIYSSGGLNVRPVVYLDSSVYVVSGDGTEANPYQIAM